jgi:hypothetical protein
MHERLVLLHERRLRAYKRHQNRYERPEKWIYAQHQYLSITFG